MNYFKASILNQLFLSFLAFGLIVAIIFPYYAGFFVDWKPGMYSWFFVGCIVAGLGLGAGNYYLVKLVLLRKINSLASHATAISQKDLSRDCDLVSQDMLGDIAASMNRMSTSLRNLIQQVNADAEELEGASCNMSAVLESNSGDIQNQLSQMERIVTAVQQMASSATQIASHAEESAKVTSDADEQADVGKVAVVEAMSAVDMLASMVDQASAVITKLEAESQNIGSVLAVINGIAEQTNLLALNAAIEAARAGEHGRGFAVVADEVRTLATRTQQSTEEISNMIENLQSGTREAVDVMQRGSEQATKGVELTEQMTEVLAEISGSIRILKQMSQQIAGASKEQSTVIEEMNQNILAINQVCEQTSEGMSQVAASSQAVTANAIKLHEIVADYRT